MTLPIYELKIDEQNDAFVEAIALVENPAIESNFIAFSKDASQFKFSLNDEKMELIGPAMIPDMKILRRDASKGDYEVFFSKDTIRQIAQVFSKRGYQSNFNIEHNSNVSAESFTFQSIIVDKNGPIPITVGDYPDGTWVVGVKVQSPSVWQEIKAGKVKGFSVEGVFELFKTEMKSQHQLEEDRLNTLLEEAIKILQS